jgi:hypothetical protein
MMTVMIKTWQYMEYIQKHGFTVAFIDESGQTKREVSVAIRPSLPDAPLWYQAINEAKTKCSEPCYKDAVPVCRHGQSLFSVCGDCDWDAMDPHSTPQ